MTVFMFIRVVVQKVVRFTAEKLSPAGALRVESEVIHLGIFSCRELVKAAILEHGARL